MPSLWTRNLMEHCPQGEAYRLCCEYHKFKLQRSDNGMLAIRMEAVLDGEFADVHEFLDFYADVEWSGWLGHIMAELRAR